ncbi:dickkopf-related protein 1b isoform X2 [Sphaeramia orbicularis]|uniref:dickkopf-related protein 1b isoform X2 n=1 Tax=Sphaeramia orbicularis TaxID=375764 RepID=UPI00117E9501|nr:dickkopf-related protein 1-like isoform X2 [Sphaeramia orbicularis]
MYKEIIPELCVRRPPSIVPKLLSGKFGFRTQGRLGLCHTVIFFFTESEGKGFFFLATPQRASFEWRIMQMLSVQCFVAVCVTLFGYLGEVYAGTVLMNSNAIKNLSGTSAGKGADTVSPSPRTSPSGIGHKSPVDTLQSSVCMDDEDCGGDEFCNDARGACLPCRKSRKRCSRDSMCCAGNRCSNGVCQANDIDSTDASIIPGWHKHNNTMEHHSKKPPSTHNHQPNAVKGQEGDTCLRSTDCSEGLCCARHFWSRICKPVLTEGQVCTRHRRKGTHGLELFQRCDCGDGLACRPEKGERDLSVSRTAARNLHTCQRR